MTRTPESRIPSGRSVLTEKSTASPGSAPGTEMPTSRQRPLATKPEFRVIAPFDLPPSNSTALIEPFGILAGSTELSPSSVLETAPLVISGPLTEFWPRSKSVSELSRISSESIAFAATSDPLTASVAISPELTDSNPRSAALTEASKIFVPSTASAPRSWLSTCPVPILVERTELLSRSAVLTSPSTMSVEKTVLAA